MPVPFAMLGRWAAVLACLSSLACGGAQKSVVAPPPCTTNCPPPKPCTDCGPPCDTSSSCHHSDTTWRDLGAIPSVSNAHAALVLGSSILVGTADGVWKHALDGSGSWQRIGAPGLDVRVLRSLPGSPDTIFAGGDPGAQAGVIPFYRSDDGGATWSPGASGLFDDFGGSWIAMADLAIQPAVASADTSTPPLPVLYANMSGTSIARSRDLGNTWQYVVGSATHYLNSDCVIAILPAAPDTLYQGCEAPLDDAWIGVYDIGDTTSTLGQAHHITDISTGPGIGNRRPNGFATFSWDPASLYAGLEGGLVVVHGTDWQWLWQAPESGGSAAGAYTYVRAIWLDPKDPNHLLFGGGGAQEDSVRDGLHETHDRGATAPTVGDTSAVDLASDPIPAAAWTPDGATLALVVLHGNAVHVLVRP